MATSLRPCNQKCLLWVGPPQKLPVISNHILAITHRNAFIAILVPKLVAMVTRFCPLCMGVSQMNFPIAQTLSQNQILHECDAYNWSCGHFCDISAYFGQTLVAVATSLRPLQSQMSSLDWPTTKTAMDMSLTTEVTAFLWYFCLFWPKFGCHGNVPYTLAVRNILFGLVDP